MKTMVTILVCLFMYMLLPIRDVVALEISDFTSEFLLSNPMLLDIRNMDYRKQFNFIKIASVTTACCQESRGINLSIAEDNAFNPTSGIMPENNWLINNSVKMKSYDTDASNDTGNNPPPPININPNSQAALQNQSTKEALDRYQGAFSVPLRPSKDVQMNVNQQEIQVKIKY